MSARAAKSERAKGRRAKGGYGCTCAGLFRCLDEKIALFFFLGVKVNGGFGKIRVSISCSLNDWLGLVLVCLPSTDGDGP